MNENTNFTVIVEEDPETGDLILPFPEGLCEQLGWDTEDTLTWEDNGDGSYTISKKVETEWVLVEAVSMFRQRYMVEVPVGKSEWALDTVTMNEATEFSQKHLDETIVSHRVVSKEEALTICDIDNDYTTSWTDEHKTKTFFTEWSDQKK
jgi:hypothetical protein